MTPSVPHLPNPLLGRRRVLQGLVAAASLAAVPGLSACGSGSSGGSGTTGSGDSKGPVTFGSSYSDAVPKKAIADAMEAFKKSGGSDVTINTKDHNTYQEQISNYLQGKPDDVFSWFAGYRMRYFAGKGLATPISDLWETIGANYSAPLKEASTGSDGKQYFVPFYNYPWGVFYRPSIFKQHGYEVPKTFDEYVTLATKMKGDGLVPIAMGQKDGWPAMGTFDYINLRTNGYDFHVSLMAGKEDWKGKKVRDVFDTWKRLMPLYQENALGRTWEEAAQTLQQGKAGMYVLGSFVAQQFQGQTDDLDFFAFPEIDSAHGTDTVEAPIDGFMLSKKPSNPDGAKKLLTFLASAEAQQAYLKSDPTSVATNSKADTSGYNALQKKSVEFIGKAKHITQFLDRDTDPRFASDAMTNGLIAFFRNPGDIDTILNGISDQAKTIFTN